jgi:nucleoside-diphosphate kinase
MIKEKTLVVVKPDGIQRTLIGEIIGRLERVGLKLVGIKMIIPTSDLVKKHYTIDPEWIEKVGQKAIDAYLEKEQEPKTKKPTEAGEKILEVLTSYMTSGPVVAMVWQGANAVGVVRKIVGTTEPMTSDVGTIRGDFVLDSYKIADVDGRAVRNLVHASGTVEEAEKETKLWFEDNEISNYRLVQEQIIYDVNLDGILE